MLLSKHADIDAPVAPMFLWQAGECCASNLTSGIPESYCEQIDVTGFAVVPGFIDGHVHITGGGGWCPAYLLFGSSTCGTRK